MTRGTLNLLGKPRALTADGREVPLPPLSYILAGFLLLEQPSGAADRNDVAAFLWRDAIQTRASLNLHRLIFQIVEAQSGANVEYFIIRADKISLNYSSIEIDVVEYFNTDEISRKSNMVGFMSDLLNRSDISILSEAAISDTDLADWIRKVNHANIIAFAGIQFLKHCGSASASSKTNTASVCADPVGGPNVRMGLDAKLRSLFSSCVGAPDARFSHVSYVRHVLSRVDEKTIADLCDQIRCIALNATREALAGPSGPANAEIGTRETPTTAPDGGFPLGPSASAASLAMINGTRERALSFSSIVLPPELSESHAHFILSETFRRISNRLSAHDFGFANKIDIDVVDGQSMIVYRHIPSARSIYVKIAVVNIFDNITVNSDIFADSGKHVSRTFSNISVGNSTYVIYAVTESVVADVRGLDGGAWSAPMADEACARLVRFGRRMLSTLDAPSLRRALACFESALRIAPDAPEALAGASRTCVLEWFTQLNPASDRLDRAERHARRIIELHPDMHLGYQELGYVQLYRRQFDSSVDNITRSVKLDPGNRGCLSDLAATLLYTGQPAAALDVLRPSFDPLNPGDEIDHWTAAAVNYTLENYKEAIRHLAAIREPRIGIRLVAASHAMLRERELADFHANFGKACTPGFQLGNWLPMLPIAERSQLRQYEEGLRSAGFT